MLKKLLLLICFLPFFKPIYAQASCDTLLFNQANDCFNRRNYDSAISLYNQVIQKCPAFVASYLNRGISYYNLGQIDNAKSDFEMTVKTAKHKYKLAMYIGNILFDADDYFNAYTYFSNASVLDDSASEPYFKMGRCMWLTRVKILEANKVEDYSKDTALKTHLKDEIIRYYSKAIYLDSLQNDTYYLSADRDAISDETTNYEYYYDRAIIEMDFAEYSNALADYEKSIQIHPTINAYQYAAYLAKKVGQNQKACGYIQMWATMFNPTESIDPFKKHEIADKFCKDLGIEKK